MRLAHFIVLSLTPLALSNAIPNPISEAVPELHAIYEIRNAVPEIAALPEPIGSVVNSVLALLTSLLQTLTTGLDAGSVPTGLLGNFTDAIAALKGPLPGIPALPLPVPGLPTNGLPLPNSGVPKLPVGDLPKSPFGDLPLTDLPLPDLPSTDDLPDLPTPDLADPDLPISGLPVPDFPMLDPFELGFPWGTFPKLPTQAEGTQTQDPTSTEEVNQDQDVPQEEDVPGQQEASQEQENPQEQNTSQEQEPSREQESPQEQDPSQEQEYLQEQEPSQGQEDPQEQEPSQGEVPAAEVQIPTDTPMEVDDPSANEANNSSIPDSTAPIVSDPSTPEEDQESTTPSDAPQLGNTDTRPAPTGFETSFVTPTEAPETSAIPSETLVPVPEANGVPLADVPTNDLTDTADPDAQVPPTSTVPTARKLRRRYL